MNKGRKDSKDVNMFIKPTKIKGKKLWADEHSEITEEANADVATKKATHFLPHLDSLRRAGWSQLTEQEVLDYELRALAKNQEVPPRNPE